MPHQQVMTHDNRRSDIKVSRYKANITAGSLLVSESRKIGQLLLEDVDKLGWKEAVENQNILQKRSLATANRIAALIKARLKLVKPELWSLVVHGDSRVATHAVLAAAIKHCRLLGDYLDLVVREQFRRLEDRLSLSIWDDYIIGCMQRDPLMKRFPDSTAVKARSNIHKILVEAGYLRDSRSKILQRIEIAPEVIEYLEINDEQYVLRCIQV